MRAKQRGITIIFALAVVFIVLAVSLTIFGDAMNSASNSASVKAKNDALNAATAGLDAAIYALDGDKTLQPGPCPKPSGTLDNASFDCYIAANHLNSLIGTTVADPGGPAGATILVPAKTAYGYGSVPSSAGRRTYVEAIVTRASPVVGRASPMPFPAAGVNAQGNIYYQYNPQAKIIGDVRANSAIYWNHVGSTPVDPPVIGGTYGATVNQLPATNGMHTGATGLAFPTPAEMLQFQANAKALARAGRTMSPGQILVDCMGNGAVGGCTGNLYVSGDLHLSNGVAFIGGGTVYIDGSVNISGQGGLWNVGPGIIVVAGAFQASGQYFNSTNLGQLVVFGTGTAISLKGQSAPAGLIYAPFGSIELIGNGSAMGSLNSGTTPLQSGGDISFKGGGSGGGFAKSVVSTALSDGELRTTSYWEY